MRSILGILHNTCIFGSNVNAKFLAHNIFFVNYIKLLFEIASLLVFIYPHSPYKSIHFVALQQSSMWCFMSKVICICSLLFSTFCDPLVSAKLYVWNLYILLALGLQKVRAEKVLTALCMHVSMDKHCSYEEVFLKMQRPHISPSTFQAWDFSNNRRNLKWKKKKNECPKKCWILHHFPLQIKRLNNPQED